MPSQGGPKLYDDASRADWGEGGGGGGSEKKGLLTDWSPSSQRS